MFSMSAMLLSLTILLELGAYLLLFETGLTHAFKHAVFDVAKNYCLFVKTISSYRNQAGIATVCFRDLAKLNLLMVVRF